MANPVHVVDVARTPFGKFNGALAVVAGGVESMTRAPFVLPKEDRAFPHRNAGRSPSAIAVVLER